MTQQTNNQNSTDKKMMNMGGPIKKIKKQNKTRKQDENSNKRTQKD